MLHSLTLSSQKILVNYLPRDFLGYLLVKATSNRFHPLMGVVTLSRSQAGAKNFELGF